jgi:hypothetical protein
VTGTPGGSVSGLQIQIIGNAGTGTVIVESLRLVRGSHPGLEVLTTDTPIPAPVSPALDPAWQQNGRIKVRILPPPISTGKSYAYLGSAASYLLSVLRATATGASDHTIWLERMHNGPTGVNTIGTNVPGRSALSSGGAVFLDGVPHDLEAGWTNEIRESDGVREMWLRFWLDGKLLAERNVAALFGASEWLPIDVGTLLSDGSVNAVICGPRDGGVIISRPTPRAGYRQVERAA